MDDGGSKENPGKGLKSCMKTPGSSAAKPPISFNNIVTFTDCASTEALRSETQVPDPFTKFWNDIKGTDHQHKELNMEAFKKLGMLRLDQKVIGMEIKKLEVLAMKTKVTSLMKQSFVHLFMNYVVVKMFNERLSFSPGEHVNTPITRKLWRILLCREETVDEAFEELRMIEKMANNIFVSVRGEDLVAVRGMQAAEMDAIQRVYNRNEDVFGNAKWQNYLEFFAAPVVTYLTQREALRNEYILYLNTGMVQAMLADKVSLTRRLVSWTIPEYFHERFAIVYYKQNNSYELTVTQDENLDLHPIARVDRHFSNYKSTNTCTADCPGHQGKLLLTLIRMGLHNMVSYLLLQEGGVSPTSECCAGSSVNMYWEEGPMLTPQMMKRFPGFTSAEWMLKSEWQMVTPLSRAAECGDLEMINLLLQQKASPLQCQDAAIRSCISMIAQRRRKNTNKILASDYKLCTEIIIKEAKSRLAKRAEKVQANYCTTVLIYEAARTQDWEALTNLTTYPQKRKQKEAEDKQAALELKTKEKAKAEEASARPKSVRKGRLDTLTRNGSSRTTTSNKSSKKDSKRGNATPLTRTYGSIKGRNWASVRGSMRGSIIGSVRNSVKVNKGASPKHHVNPALVQMVVSAIDMLLTDGFRKNATTHAAELKGIAGLLDRNDIYLNKRRFQLITLLVFKALDEYLPGDEAAISAILHTEQMMHYLQVADDEKWRYRKITYLIEEEKLPPASAATKKASYVYINRRKAEEAEEEPEDRIRIKFTMKNLFSMTVSKTMTSLYRRLTDGPYRRVLDTELIRDTIRAAAVSDNVLMLDFMTSQLGRQYLFTAFQCAYKSNSLKALSAVIKMLMEHKAYFDPAQILQEVLRTDAVARTVDITFRDLIDHKVHKKAFTKKIVLDAYTKSLESKDLLHPYALLELLRKFIVPKWPQYLSLGIVEKTLRKVQSDIKVNPDIVFAMACAGVLFVSVNTTEDDLSDDMLEECDVIFQMNPRLKYELLIYDETADVSPQF